MAHMTVKVSEFGPLAMLAAGYIGRANVSDDERAEVFQVAALVELANKTNDPDRGITLTGREALLIVKYAQRATE